MADIVCESETGSAAANSVHEDVQAVGGRILAERA
jgi:hypothetical protein